MGVLRIATDAGIEGINFLSYPGPGPLAIAHEIVTFVKPLLLGADPLEIGRHWRCLCNLGHFINPITVGVVDVALWDIAGQAAGLPVHRLLGNCRDRLPVYLSSAHHASGPDYAEEAVYWRGQGWRGSSFTRRARRGAPILRHRSRSTSTRARGSGMRWGTR